MLVVVAVTVGGLVLLAFAPDRFVAGSAGLADRWGVSRVVIGAVVIGFGTSSPELLVGGLATARGEPAVGVGNIVGSNMANLGLIVGVAALVGTIAVPAGLLRRELPLVVAATVGFAVVVQNGLDRFEGVVLLLGLVAALAALLRGSGPGPDLDEPELANEVAEFVSEDAAQPPWRLVAAAMLGLLGTLVGAQLLVTGALEIADRLDLSGGFVGMTVVALGTSLPELVTAVAATRAGEDQLVLGNLIGSNLFNCLAVGAVVALAGPSTGPDPGIAGVPVLLMLGITALATVAMTRRQTVTKGEAVTLLVSYLGCMPFLAA